ncbi:hypothetical protein CRX72_20910 [Pantoea sp. BRM17]|nr:hypothetical protein CRX72_20910 [Pantoea sp. BRM17]
MRNSPMSDSKNPSDDISADDLWADFP